MFDFAEKNIMNLPADWTELLKNYSFDDLFARVEAEYEKGIVYPPKDKIFTALDFCSVANTKVVILGQDPYFNPGQATGMAFSIDPEIRGLLFPPTLLNIIKEIRAEFNGKCEAANGDLTKWAKQGVLLLNTSLTVKKGIPNSHVNLGWNKFTNAVITEIDKIGGIVFILWGNNAKSYIPIISNPDNLVLTSVHPSPLSASNGFFGCNHFKKTNDFLLKLEKTPIVW